MSRSTSNEQLVERLRETVAQFQAGRLDLDELQAALQSAMSLAENDGSNTRDVIRGAEADVEEIRFTRLLDEQRPAIVFLLDELLTSLDGDRTA